MALWTKKEIKGIQIGKKDGKLSLFADYMIISMLLLLLSCFSRVQLCATLWTAAHQAPLSTGYSRQECWSGLPLPSLKMHQKCET